MNYRRDTKTIIKVVIILNVITFLAMIVLTAMASENPNSIIIAIYSGIVHIASIIFLINLYRKI